MVEAGTVRRLLETIESRLARLERASEVSLDAYLQDADLQAIVERNFEVAIQACIDLGLHMLADVPQPLPDTNRGVFTALAEAGFVGAAPAADLERMAGFRNVLAHVYAEVDARLVHALLGRLEDIRRYVASLHGHLRREGVLD